jgi:hypothetical protein
MTYNLAKAMHEEKSTLNSDRTHYDNFFTTKKPMPLSTARVKGFIDKNIKGHIIICGLV